MQWKAQWIWHPPRDKMDNFYMHARKEFSLPSVPEDARILVTASSLYKLYVNGQYVGRGPNPSDPRRYYYDVHEVTSLLKRGRNVIAALCYNYGEKTRGILGQNWGRGGFLLELRAPGTSGRTLLATDGTWRVLQSPAWQQDAPLNCTLYGDFKEIFDSRLEPQGWLDVGFDDSQWPLAHALGRPPVKPWKRLIEREIPFMDCEWVYPVNAFWESASVTYSWREDYEVYDHHSLVPGNPHARPGKVARIMKTHEDFDPSIILDFGRDVTGYLRIVIQNSGGGIMDVLYGEDLYLTRVDTFILRGGPQVLEPYNRRTFRYAKLLLRQTPQPVEIKEVALRMSTYPVEEKGAFCCSDELLNRIWEVGRYTIRMSMLDHFVDCPWRERTLYGGDMFAENLIAHYAFGDPRMNRKCLRQMAAIQYPCGALPPYGPYSGCDGFYPPWSAFWGLALLDHYDFTGDRELLKELWPNLRKLLRWAIGEMDNPVGLIGRPSTSMKRADRGPGWSPIKAWMSARRDRYLAWDNVPFQPLLRRSAQAARALGKKAEAVRYEQAAQRMAKALLTHLMDERGLALGATSGHAGHTGQYHNALFLWAGLLEQGQGRLLGERIFGPEVQPIDAPFHGLFVAEGLYRYGADQRALDFTRQYWGDMLRRGATTYWDNFSLQWPAGLLPERGTSLCHGWAAAPTYTLPAYVLGVRPMAPGFRRILVEPRPADLSWAAGRVPTPHGLVHVRWSRSADFFRLELTVPAGCSASVSLPAEGRRPAAATLDGRAVQARREGERLAVDVPEGEHAVELRW